MWDRPGVHLYCGRAECQAIDDCAHRDGGKPCWARKISSEPAEIAIDTVVSLTLASPQPLFNEYIGFGHEEP